MTTKTYNKPEVEIYNFAAEAGFQVSLTSENDQTSGFGFNGTDNDKDAWE